MQVEHSLLSDQDSSALCPETCPNAKTSPRHLRGRERLLPNLGAALPLLHRCCQIGLGPKFLALKIRQQ